MKTLVSHRVSRHSLIACLLALLSATSLSTQATTILQRPGTSHVAFEAEHTATLIPGDPSFWEVINDAAAGASGGQALIQNGGNNPGNSPHGFAQYQIRFAGPGEYYLYSRWRADPARTAGDVFTANSSWFPRQFGSFTTIGEAGRDPFYTSAANGTQAPANHTYAWTREALDTALPVSQVDAQSGTALLFTIGTREAGTIIDRFVLSTDPDLTPAALDSLANAPTDIIRQVPGQSFLAFEAERAATFIPGDPTFWSVIDDTAAGASGGQALVQNGDNNPGNSPHGFAQYRLQFTGDGGYYMYSRWRADPARTAADVFAANSSWFPRQFGSFTTIGEAGRDPFYTSAANGTQAPANNTYAWTREALDTVLAVSPADVQSGGPLILTIGTREAGTIIDRFVLSTDPNLTSAALDSLVNSGDAPTLPELVKASGSASLASVTVTFSRLLNPATVIPANFSINGVAVTGASLDVADPRVVHLTTAAQVAGTHYTLTVNNVRDTSGATIAPNSTVGFTAWRLAEGWVRRDLFLDIPGTSTFDLQGDLKYLANTPDRVVWGRGFQLHQDPNIPDYGARLSGFFTPPASGVYELFVYSDDESELHISTNASEANLQWIGQFFLSPPVFDEWNIAITPSLVANQQHLLVGLLKQGGGDVYFNVAARRQGDSTPVATLPTIGGPLIASYVDPDIGVVTFDTQPQSTQVVSGHRARFESHVTAQSAPVYYQWQVHNGDWQDIPGAIRPAYITPVLGSSDNGRRYRLVVSVAGTDNFSDEAVATVVPGNPPAFDPFIGINFVGGGTGGGGSLLATDVAGAVRQSHWNNVTGTTAESFPLGDATGSPTPVTLTYTAFQAWYSGTAFFPDADGLLLQGYVNTTNDTEPFVFQLANVPPGEYAVLVYSTGFLFQATYEQDYQVQGATQSPVYTVRAQTGFDYNQAPGFVRMSSTNPAARDLGNYVRFDDVSPAIDGTLTLRVTSQSPNPGNNHIPAVNAIQLARIPTIQPIPVLDVALEETGSSIVLSWDEAAAGSVLETRTNLESGGTWAPVHGVPNPLQGSGSITLPASATEAWYRTSRPN